MRLSIEMRLGLSIPLNLLYLYTYTATLLSPHYVTVVLSFSAIRSHHHHHRHQYIPTNNSNNNVISTRNNDDIIQRKYTNVKKNNIALYSTLSSDASTSARGTPLPPAIAVEGLSCSHDGGSIYQLKDVAYVLPRGGKIGLVGRKCFIFRTLVFLCLLVECS